MIKTQDWPDKNFRWFITDPLGNGFIYYRTEEDMIVDSKRIISHYLDDGWDEEVRDIQSGYITHVSTEVDVLKRPDDSELDENGCDEDGNDFSEFDYICNYSLKEIGDDVLRTWAEEHGYVRMEELLKLKEMMLKEDYENGA